MRLFLRSTLSTLHRLCHTGSNSGERGLFENLQLLCKCIVTMHLLFVIVLGLVVVIDPGLRGPRTSSKDGS